MRRKAIKDLIQLPDDGLFGELETGFELCLRNAARIEEDAALLFENKRGRGGRILQLAAQEEAAKVLILLDAVRCPRSNNQEFARQLRNFHSHLAKGIYAQYCSTRPATFGETREWIERDRKEYYLDGPNDIDWIFYNDILREREDTVYVDYYESDGEHNWHDPLWGEGMESSRGDYVPSNVLRLANAMLGAGCLKSAALREIARLWRDVRMHDDFRWLELQRLNHNTLTELDAKSLLIKHPNEVYSTIVNEWLFPLWPLDVCTFVPVDQTELRGIQEAWNPDWP